MYKQFGIISGAGPMAGALLYSKVIELLQARGAWRDSEFPGIILMNIPFTDMLDTRENYTLVRQELLCSLNQLSAQVDFIYIACQTLHAFLSNEEIIQYKVVSLLQLIESTIHTDSQAVLVAASNTSRRLKLHNQLKIKSLQYINPDDCDIAIETILKGNKPNLDWLIEKSFMNTVILGCTEFSVACRDMGFRWIDPVQLAAIDIVKKFLSSS